MACWDILGKAAKMPVLRIARREIWRVSPISIAQSPRKHRKRWLTRSKDIEMRDIASFNSRSAATIST